MPGWDPSRGPPDGTIGSDRLIALTRADEGRRYFSLDGLRSVVNLTDDFGNEVASYHLDAWGNFRFPQELTQSANRFAFTGHIWDQETGLYNAKARYFDPKLGRFLTQDSYLGEIDEPPSLHRYLYANGNPTRFVDPDGHAACPEGATCISASETTTASIVRGGLAYGAETVAEFVSPVPLGLSDPDTAIHPLAGTTESSSWLTGDNQISADYAAFKERYGRGAQVIEGAAVAKYGGKVGKVVGLVMIAGAMMYSKPEVNGVQGEDGSLGPDKGDRDPLPAQKENAAAEQKRARLERRGLKPVERLEQTTLADFKKRSVPGDTLEGHEPVQHSQLRDAGLAGEKRLSTEASRSNPVVALDEATHDRVNAAQMEARTHEMPPKQSIRTNMEILKEHTDMAAKEVRQLYRRALTFAKEVGLLKGK